MSRSEKRELRETLQAREREVNSLKAKNKELFTFLQQERQRCKNEIQDAKAGMAELLVATNLVLGEIIRKHGEVTIPIPDIKNKFPYDVFLDKEAGTMTFRRIEKTAEDAEKSAGEEEKISET